jgi:hypothetical protein
MCLNEPLQALASLSSAGGTGTSKVREGKRANLETVGPDRASNSKGRQLSRRTCMPFRAKFIPNAGSAKEHHKQLVSHRPPNKQESSRR